jgi:glutamate 5-kinase
MTNKSRPHWPFTDRPIRRVLVKCGSNVLSTSLGTLDLQLINRLALEISSVLQQGVEVVFVSSGAVACGIGIMGRAEKPKSIPEKQALAAIGQCRLMHIYSSIFDTYNVKIAQLLLTREDMEDRRRYLNAEYTLSTLLNQKVLPVVNENDTVTVEELKFGDNDGLAALISSKLEVDLFVILTDVEGLMSANPSEDPNARLVPVIGPEGAEAYTVSKVGGRSKFGSGGMSSKLEAVRVASMAGVTSVIANGRRQGVLGSILGGEETGTLFLPQPGVRRLSARSRWILTKSARGRRLIVDDGARKALLEGKKSLLPVGVIEVEGDFEKGDVVEICDKQKTPLAQGLVNFSSDIVHRIKGLKTPQIAKVFGDLDYPEVVHRDNLVVHS